MNDDNIYQISMAGSVIIINIFMNNICCFNNYTCTSWSPFYNDKLLKIEY